MECPLKCGAAQKYITKSDLLGHLRNVHHGSGEVASNWYCSYHRTRVASWRRAFVRHIDDHHCIERASEPQHVPSESANESQEMNESPIDNGIAGPELIDSFRKYIDSLALCAYKKSYLDLRMCTQA